MKNKDLAEEYLDKVADSAIYFKKGKFPDMPLFQGKDIKDAFNAGRPSIINNIYRLEWEDVGTFDELALSEIVCRAKIPFGKYTIVRWVIPNTFTFLDEKNYGTQKFRSLEEAKRYASNLHSRRIREELGILPKKKNSSNYGRTRNKNYSNS